MCEVKGWELIAQGESLSEEGGWEVMAEHWKFKYKIILCLWIFKFLALWKFAVFNPWKTNPYIKKSTYNKDPLSMGVSLRSFMR